MLRIRLPQPELSICRYMCLDGIRPVLERERDVSDVVMHHLKDEEGAQSIKVHVNVGPRSSSKLSKRASPRIAVMTGLAADSMHQPRMWVWVWRTASASTWSRATL